MPNVGVYIPDPLNDRIQRLRELGVDIKISATCQQGLEAKVEAEESALSGDRLHRLLARLGTTKTMGERVAARGEAVGRQWAEDVAALSELRRAKHIMTHDLGGPVDVFSVRIAGRVSLGLVVWDDDGDVEPAGDVTLPESVPKEFFEHADEPEEGISYLSSKVRGFLRGAADVLDTVEQALASKQDVL